MNVDVPNPAQVEGPWKGFASTDWGTAAAAQDAAGGKAEAGVDVAEAVGRVFI